MHYRSSLIAAVAATALLAPTAQAATKKLSGGRTAAAAAAATPESSRVVTLVGPGNLQVRSPGATARTFAVPAGCTLTPAMTSREAFVCAGKEGDPIAVNLATGVERTLPARTPLTQDEEPFTPTAAGSRWLKGDIALIDSQLGDHGATVSVIVDRKTGRQIDVNGNFGRRVAKRWGAKRYVDLNRAEPARALCRPVKRSRIGSTYGDLVKVGSWTVRQTATRSILQRCGSSRSTSIPSRVTVLGRKHVAWIHGRHVTIRTLRSRRTRTFRLTHSRASIALSSNRLIISQALSGGRWQINTIPIG